MGETEMLDRRQWLLLAGFELLIAATAVTHGALILGVPQLMERFNVGPERIAALIGMARLPGLLGLLIGLALALIADAYGRMWLNIVAAGALLMSCLGFALTTSMASATIAVIVAAFFQSLLLPLAVGALMEGGGRLGQMLSLAALYAVRSMASSLAMILIAKAEIGVLSCYWAATVVLLAGLVAFALAGGPSRTALPEAESGNGMFYWFAMSLPAALMALLITLLSGLGTMVPMLPLMTVAQRGALEPSEWLLRPIGSTAGSLFAVFLLIWLIWNRRVDLRLLATSALALSSVMPLLNFWAISNGSVLVTVAAFLESGGTVLAGGILIASLPRLISRHAAVSASLLALYGTVWASFLAPFLGSLAMRDVTPDADFFALCGIPLLLAAALTWHLLGRNEPVGKGVPSA